LGTARHTSVRNGLRQLADVKLDMRRERVSEERARERESARAREREYRNGIARHERAVSARVEARCRLGQEHGADLLVQLVKVAAVLKLVAASRGRACQVAVLIT